MRLLQCLLQTSSAALLLVRLCSPSHRASSAVCAGSCPLELASMCLPSSSRHVKACSRAGGYQLCHARPAAAFHVGLELSLWLAAKLQAACGSHDYIFWCSSPLLSDERLSMHDCCPPPRCLTAALPQAQEPPASSAAKVEAATGDPGCGSSQCKLCMQTLHRRSQALSYSCRSLLASLQPSWTRRMRRLWLR